MKQEGAANDTGGPEESPVKQTGVANETNRGGQ